MILPTLYVAGPMSGLPDHNYPTFNNATEELEAVGYPVLNPARRGIIDGYTWADYMRHSIRDVLDADGIALLPGWHASKGARLEAQIGNALGLRIRDAEWWLRKAGKSRKPDLVQPPETTP